jgi:hypothetical protein
MAAGANSAFAQLDVGKSARQLEPRRGQTLGEWDALLGAQKTTLAEPMRRHG